jgi:hypothetical protein
VGKFEKINPMSGLETLGKVLNRLGVEVEIPLFKWGIKSNHKPWIKPRLSLLTFYFLF